MGIEKRETYNYFNVSRGKLRYKENGQTSEANAYTGTIVAIREKTGEYDGQPTIKVEVKMKDTDSDAFAIIQFTKEALFCLGFFARIRKVDLSKPVTIGVVASDKNEKVSFCYLKQSCYKGNPDPNKAGIIDKDKSFPSYTTVKISGKDVSDYTAPFEEIEKIMKELTEKLAAHAGLTRTPNAIVPDSKDDSDLPF